MVTKTCSDQPRMHMYTLRNHQGGTGDSQHNSHRSESEAKVAHNPEMPTTKQKSMHNSLFPISREMFEKCAQCAHTVYRVIWWADRLIGGSRERENLEDHRRGPHQSPTKEINKQETFGCVGASRTAIAVFILLQSFFAWISGTSSIWYEENPCFSFP